MSGVDIAHLREWIGKSECSRDVLSSRHARLMAATSAFRSPASSTAHALRFGIGSIS
jgi:hypothetical protein